MFDAMQSVNAMVVYNVFVAYFSYSVVVLNGGVKGEFVCNCYSTERVEVYAISAKSN